MKLAKRNVGPVTEDDKAFMLENLDKAREAIVNGTVTGLAFGITYYDGSVGTSYRRAHTGNHFTMLGAIHQLAFKLSTIIKENGE